MAISEVRARVAAQRTALPVMYGDIDFTITPERFTLQRDESVLRRQKRRLPVEPTPEQIEMVRAYTMLGDVVADAYAALMPQYGFRTLVAMLTTACDRGVAAVPDAPPELAAFIRAMEQAPAWVDMDLVREGQRLERNMTANAAPFMIRGAFLATFLNKYSALPMALTGTLSHDTAAKRVNETATFFATTTLPGALERHGEGFKAAAMVRLMHSMVRYNVLRRSGRWDVAVYGVPIPQLDQMPAGLIPVFLLAFRMLAEGRTSFTAEERARVELSRYRCFLLGLPEDLLADTPEGIVQMMTARNGTLRDGFDDATCGVLVRATLAAYLPPDRSLPNRLFAAVEQRFAKVVFLTQFLGNDRAAAARIGVDVGRLDMATFVLAGLFINARLTAYRLAMRSPLLRGAADRALVRKIRRLLVRYGHAHFTTDADQYRQAAAKPGSASERPAKAA